MWAANRRSRSTKARTTLSRRWRAAPDPATTAADAPVSKARFAVLEPMRAVGSRAQALVRTRAALPARVRLPRAVV